MCARVVQVEPMYRTATMLKVFRGADTALEDVGIEHEERLWRLYLVHFMVRVFYGDMQLSPMTGTSNAGHVAGFPGTVLQGFGYSAAAWARMVALPTLQLQKHLVPQQKMQADTHSHTNDAEHVFSALVHDAGNYKPTVERALNSFIRADVRSQVRETATDDMDLLSLASSKKRMYNQVVHTNKRAREFNDGAYEEERRTSREREFEVAARQGLPPGQVFLRDRYR